MEEDDRRTAPFGHIVNREAVHFGAAELDFRHAARILPDASQAKRSRGPAEGSSAVGWPSRRFIMSALRTG